MPSWEDCVSMYYSARPVNVDIRFILQVLFAPALLQELLITAVLLASKTLDDRVYSNSHFARVAGIPTVAELNRLEWNMFTMLD
eukprot:IDg18777t1